MNKIVALWATCRSRSTMFLRVIKERGDFLVFNEAFCDLATIGRYQHPNSGRRVASPRELIELIEDSALEHPVFFKETCEQSLKHLEAERRFLDRAVHTFIIREPAATINSHYAMNRGVTRDEIGYAHLLDMFYLVRDRLGRQPIVVNSTDLIEAPERVMRAYCERAGVAFIPSALEWQPGPIEEWRRTQPWHRVVSQSNGIHRHQTRYRVTVDNDPRLRGYYDYHKPFYDELESHNFLRR